MLLHQWTKIPLFGSTPESLSWLSHPRTQDSKLLSWRSSGTSQLKSLLPHNLPQPVISKDRSGKFSWQSLQRLKSLSSSSSDGLTKSVRKISLSQLWEPNFTYLNFQEQQKNKIRSPGSLSWTTRPSSCSLVSYQVCLKHCSVKDSTDRQHHQEHGQVKGRLGKHPKATSLSRLANCLWS